MLVFGVTFGQYACRGDICPGQGIVKDGELGIRAVALQQVQGQGQGQGLYHAHLGGEVRLRQQGGHLNRIHS